MKLRRGKSLPVIACIAALAVLPILPYAIYGYAGQDFEYHVTAWLGLRTAWLTGHALPMWDPRANFGLGDVHLGMYPPGAMYVGGVLAMLMPLRYVPAFFVWIVTALSGVAMYWASRDFVAQRDRLAAALLYMLSPYLVTTALVRFAAGELLVQMLLPLLLLFFYRVVWLHQTRAVWLLGAVLGISWFTNVPESVALFYLLLIVAAIFAGMQRSVLPVMLVAAAEILAGALAAFYLAPLWVERHWINQAGLIRIDPQRLLLFMPYSGSAVETMKVFKYSCWLFACVIMLLVLSNWWTGARPVKGENATRTWRYLAVVAFLFQLPIALVLWRHLPQIGLVAFPFRFLPVMGAAVPLVLLARGSGLVYRRLAYCLVAAMTLVPLLEHARTQATASTRMPRFAELERRWRIQGYEGMPEFVPPGAIRPRGPSEVSTLTVDASGQGSNCSLRAEHVEADEFNFHVTSDVPCQIRVPIYAYPYWHGTVSDGSGLPLGSDVDHTLIVAVSPGAHDVSLAFEPRSKVRTVSRILSVAAWLAFFFFFVRAWMSSSRVQSTRV